MLEIMFLFTAAILIRSATQTDIRGDQMSISLENACCENFYKDLLYPPPSPSTTSQKGASYFRDMNLLPYQQR